MNKYIIHGLLVASEIDFPELEPYNHTSTFVPDVLIHHDNNLPLNTTPPTQSHNNIKSTPNRLFIDVDNVGVFYIKNGCDIAYKPLNDANQDSLRAHLLGVCMITIMYQKNVIVLHGSAFKYADFSVIFTGHSGMGKSTMIMAIMQMGYSVLSDEACAISADNMVIPSQPIVQLWADCINALSLKVSPYQPTNIKLGKQSVIVDNFYNSKPIPVKYIFNLKSHDSNQVTMKKLSLGKKLTTILEHSLALDYLRESGLINNHFTGCC